MSPFKEIFDLEKKTLEQHSRMIKPLEMVGVGIAITTRLNNKVLMDIMKRNDLTFKTNEDVRSFGRKTERFTIVSSTGEELTLYPTSIGYMVDQSKLKIRLEGHADLKLRGFRELIVELDPDDPNPESTIDCIQEAVRVHYANS